MSGQFSIPVKGLAVGYYSFDFEIDKKFFDLFEESEIKNGSLKATVKAEKGATHIDISVVIEGHVEVICDRCLESFAFPLHCENRLIAEFSGENTDDPDILIISHDEPELDMKQYFYEFILLALPIQRIHPESKDGISSCNPTMIKKLDEHRSIEDDNNNDPRWDALKNLKNN
jgi:uncharacterized metal-binding protein YceD (DUF177 family)